MAPLAFGLMGSAIGAGIGGTFMGMSAASIGWSIGSTIGSLLFAPDTPTQHLTGPRLHDLSVQSATRGKPIPKAFGAARMAGNVIWTSGIKETTHVQTQGGGKGGGGGSSSSTTYTYDATFAIGICKGPIAGIRRIWADSILIYNKGDASTPEELAVSNNFAGTIYNGTESQSADPTIQATNADTPAYRGLAYVVFNNFQLEKYGNRIPNFTFEVVEAGGLGLINQLHHTGFYYPESEGGGWSHYWLHCWNMDNSGNMMVVYTSYYFVPFPDEEIGGNRRIGTYHVYNVDISGNHTYRFTVDSILADRESGGWSPQSQYLVRGYTEDQSFVTLTKDYPTNKIALNQYDYNGNFVMSWGDYGGSLGSNNALCSITDRGDKWITWANDLSDEQTYYKPYTDTGLGSGTKITFPWSGSTYSIDRIWYLQPMGTKMIVVGGADNGGSDIKIFVCDAATATILEEYRSPDYALDPSKTPGYSFTPRNGSVNGISTPNWAFDANGNFIMLANDSSGGLGHVAVHFVGGSETIDKIVDLSETASTPDTKHAWDQQLNASHRNLYFRNDIYAAFSVRQTDVKDQGPEVGAWSFINHNSGYLALGEKRLSDIITDLCLEVGLTTADIDVSDLTTVIVKGYSRTATMSARSAMEHLLKAYNVTGAESEHKIKFIRNDGTSGTTIDATELSASEGGEVDPLTIIRKEETELPMRVNILYSNFSGDYLTGVQHAKRITL